MYLTGDLVRMHQDGNIEFVDRMDNQVKIRGVRIETDEVASILLQHSQIRDVVVKKDTDAGGVENLCAFIVFEDAPMDVHEVREYLLEYLPEYMVPTSYVKIDYIPFTVNSKIDYQKLSSMEARLNRSGSLVEPETPQEKELQKIWSIILYMEPSQIGVTDSFFDIGGNSMKMLSLVSTINEKFNQNIKITDIFRFNTIRDISMYISGTSESENKQA